MRLIKMITPLIYLITLVLIISSCQKADNLSANLGDNDNSEAKTSGVASRTYLWEPGSIIKVKFLNDGTYSEDVKERYKIAIIKAFKTFDFINLKFKFLNEGSLEKADIRISFEQFTARSHIGTRALDIPDDKATMWFYNTHIVYSKENVFDGVIKHEILHALALDHEDVHPRSGSYFKTLHSNFVKDGYTSEMAQEKVDDLKRDNVIKELLNYYKFSKNYDKKSIMHQGIPKRIGYDHYPSPIKLSKGDKKFLKELYPF